MAVMGLKRESIHNFRSHVGMGSRGQCFVGDCIMMRLTSAVETGCQERSDADCGLGGGSTKRSTGIEVLVIVVSFKGLPNIGDLFGKIGGEFGGQVLI